MITRQVLGYLSVSGVCVALNNALLIVLDFAGFSLAAAVLTSFTLVCVTGYILHSRVSFQSSMSAGRFLRYCAAMSTNVPLALFAIWAWRDVAGLPMLCAAPLATASATAVNFVLCHWAVFEQKGVVSH